MYTHWRDAVRAVVRADGEYWRGWHDARPLALRAHGTAALEDPTRGGGWCVEPIPRVENLVEGIHY